MAEQALTVTTEQLAQLQATLCAKGHDTMADAIRSHHPRILDASHVRETGGGCQAYIVELSASEQIFFVIWTTDDGSDLATGDDFMIGVYHSDDYPGDALALIEN